MYVYVIFVIFRCLFGKIRVFMRDEIQGYFTDLALVHLVCLSDNRKINIKWNVQLLKRMQLFYYRVFRPRFTFRKTPQCFGCKLDCRPCVSQPECNCPTLLGDTITMVTSCPRGWHVAQLRPSRKANQRRKSRN